jgi:hypothetical protein
MLSLDYPSLIALWISLRKAVIISRKYEVCFIRIKKQVGEKRGTVGTNMNADSVGNKYTKHMANMLSIEKLAYVNNQSS